MRGQPFEWVASNATLHIRTRRQGYVYAAIHRLASRISPVLPPPLRHRQRTLRSRFYTMIDVNATKCNVKYKLLTPETERLDFHSKLISRRTPTALHSRPFHGATRRVIGHLSFVTSLRQSIRHSSSEGIWHSTSERTIEFVRHHARIHTQHIHICLNSLDPSP